MEQSAKKVSFPNRATLRYRLHWHVLFTHFPVSFFLGSFGFAVLHLFTATSCFEMAAYVALIAGAVFMIPTTVSGWFTWKGRYKGGRGRIFLYKIRISFIMLGLSWFLVVYHAIFAIGFLDILHNAWHALYFIGVALLLIGAITEGYYGGRLNHR